MSIYTLISPKVRENMLFIRGMFKKGKKSLLKEIETLSKNDCTEWYANQDDVLFWEKAYKRLAFVADNRGIQLAREFYNQPLEIINEKQKPSEQSLILICASKNESSNMKKIYLHYRKLGVKSFAFIDNNSTDGSIEMYSNMDGVNIYFAKEDYTSVRRQAWINRIMAHYGFDKWYLVVDSDEYLDYNQSEKYSIEDVIEYCSQERITRMQAMMIDMYPPKIVYDNQEVDFLSEYNFFDRNTYEKMQDRNSLLLNGYQGGVRARVFSHSNFDDKPWLTKYPLLFLEKGDIQFQSHMSFPFYKNFQSENFLVLRHYKFMPSDFEKYRKRAKNGNFAHGSREYKKYITEMEKGYIVFYEEQYTEPFYESESFYNIPVMTKIPWKDAR